MVLGAERGIRFRPKIAKWLVSNLAWLSGDGWGEVRQHATDLARHRRKPPSRRAKIAERRAADFLAEKLAGLGPKQSRNLWQDLGLTRYEIPIDSRVNKWLRKFRFPVPVEASALSNPEYYEFVLDAVQALCLKSGELPCIVDAAIFTDADGEADVELLRRRRSGKDRSAG